MDYENEINNFSITLATLKTILEGSFYDRRKTTIGEFNKYLLELYECLKNINFFFGGDNKLIDKIEQDYSSLWAQTDFYSKYSRWIGGLIYNYDNSIEYHRLRHLVLKVIDFCSILLNNKNITINGQESEVKKYDNIKIYITVNIVDFTGKINDYTKNFESYYSDNSTKRTM